MRPMAQSRWRFHNRHDAAARTSAAADQRSHGHTRSRRSGSAVTHSLRAATEPQKKAPAQTRKITTAANAGNRCQATYANPMAGPRTVGGISHATHGLKISHRQYSRIPDGVRAR
jgi:hypothetical protein